MPPAAAAAPRPTLGSADAPGGHQAGQRPLPDRLHRLGRPGAGAARRGWCWSPTAATASRRPSSWPRPASRPASRWPGVDQREVVGAAVARRRRRPPGPRGRRRHLGPAAGLRRDLVRRASSWWPHRAWSTICAWSRTTARCRASRRPRRWPTRPWPTSAAVLADGLTEQEFGIELDFEIRRLGAWGNSFETIVGSGPNGAKPHHRPSRPAHRRGRPGGARLRRGGRRLLLGHDPHGDGGRAVAHPGPHARGGHRRPAGRRGRRRRRACPPPTIDAACRQVIAEAGWGEAFLHATGHGVGPGDPRGPEGGGHRRCYAGPRRRRHRRARVSTCPTTAGCASRTPSS